LLDAKRARNARSEPTLPNTNWAYQRQEVCCLEKRCELELIALVANKARQLER